MTLTSCKYLSVPHYHPNTLYPPNLTSSPHLLARSCPT